MLTTLRIKNLALVTDLTLELQPGCNVITGETGAGKSIIIGALNLVLGERADRTLIRSGEESCSVEAVFDVAKLRAPLKTFLEENGLEPCEENQLVLKRTFTAAGTNRQFVNGSPTTLATLADIGEWLVDMHGPHDHQSLLHPRETTCDSGCFRQIGKPSATHLANSSAAARLWKVKNPRSSWMKKLTRNNSICLRFQVQEISAARLQPGRGQSRRGGIQPRQQRREAAAIEPGRARCFERERKFIAHPIRDASAACWQELQRVDAGAANLVALHAQAGERFARIAVRAFALRRKGGR